MHFAIGHVRLDLWERFGAGLLDVSFDLSYDLWMLRGRIILFTDICGEGAGLINSLPASTY